MSTTTENAVKKLKEVGRYLDENAEGIIGDIGGKDYLKPPIVRDGISISFEITNESVTKIDTDKCYLVLHDRI